MTAALCINFSGCKSEPKADKIFKYDILSNPGTLDPQQANDSISNTIIENIYLGLLTVDGEGAVSEGVASEYSVSEDGLVYNFKLREDIFWVSNDNFEKQCIAEDFVYGFKRLFLPVTGSARAADYYCIKNSKEFHNGESDELPAVRALGDFELEITLAYPNPRFAAMLAEPPAMPCCEEFFLKSQGKYGLSANCTASNGAFYVRRWNYDPHATTEGVNYLVLNRNAKNAETLGVAPSGLNFFITKGGLYSDFVGGTTHCLAVSDSEKQPSRKDFNVDEFCNTTCGLVFNNEFQLFKTTDFRRALSCLADQSTISAAISNLETAKGIVPERVTVAGDNYRETTGGCELLGYDPQKAREFYQSAKPLLDTSLFTSSRVIVCSDSAKTAVSYILQEWQREFGFYCIVETLSEKEFKDRLQSGDYEIAAVELSGKYNSPSAFLEQFCAGSTENYGRFEDGEFEKLLNSANEAADPSKSAELFHEAEQRLIDTAAFVPLFYKNEYFFTVKKSEGIVYNPFSKTINFMKAKM